MAGATIVHVNELSPRFIYGYKHSRHTLKSSPPNYGYHQGDINEYLQLPLKSILSDIIKTERKAGSPIGFLGGPPCPDFSIGGKNRGSSGDNGILTATYFELIRTFKPDFFLFENVKGLWKTKRHRFFYEEQKQIAIKAGYLLTERLINAIEYGVPQDRERIILLGFSKQFLHSRALPLTQEIVQAIYPWNSSVIYQQKELFSLPWPMTNPFVEDSSLPMPQKIVPELTVEWWFNNNDVISHPNFRNCFKPRAGLARFLTIDEGDDSRKSFKRLHRWRYSPTAAYGNNEVHLHPYKAKRISVSEALAIQSLPKNFQLQMICH